MTQIIGDVAQIEWRMYRDSDFDIDIRWWQDLGKTIPRNIQDPDGAGGQVKDGWSGPELIDLADYLTIGANAVALRIPASAVNAILDAGIDVITHHIWLIDAVTGEQERVEMGYGHVSN